MALNNKFDSYLTTSSASSTYAPKTHSHGWTNLSSQLTSNSAYTAKLLVNEDLQLAQVSYVRSAWAVSKGSTSTSNIGVPSPYRPKHRMINPFGSNAVLYLDVDGSITMDNQAGSNATSGGVNTQWVYYYGAE